MLGDEVNDESANRLVSQLLVLSNDDPDSDISLFVNSPPTTLTLTLYFAE